MRRPVPREWREIHHELDLRTTIAGGGWGGHRRTYRSKGFCSCGAQWPWSRNANNLQADDVRDYWRNHVEAMFYVREDERDKREAIRVVSTVDIEMRLRWSDPSLPVTRYLTDELERRKAAA